MTIDAFRPSQKTWIVPDDANGAPDYTKLVEVDCTTTESPVDEATPTKLAVEEGADITDHVQLSGVRLSLGIVHTNHPAEILGLTASSSRSREFYDKLLDWQRKKTSLVVITVHRVYENMVLISIPPTWDKDTGEGFVGSLAFEEIIRVETKIVRTPKPADPSGSSKVDRGAVKGKPPSEANRQSALSALKSMVVGR